VLSMYALAVLLLWSLGDSMVEIAMTERPRLGDYDSKKVLEAMQDCLDGNRGDLMQMLALYDLSLVPSDGETTRSKKTLWRRHQIFADDTGVLWNRLASVCMDSLAGIVVGVERVEELSSTLKAKSGGANVTKWNSMPSRGSWASSEVMTEAAHCLLQIAGHHQAIVLSIRFLSDMAYVSVDEDRYGILQLSEPSVGDVLFMLIRADQKIRQLGQWTAGVQSVHGARWRASGEELYSLRRVVACLDVVKHEIGIALENLSSAFGSRTLVDVLEANGQFKMVGNTSEKAHMKAQLARINGTR